MSGQSSEPPPPQWYVDPNNAGRWRWWDGIQWTEQFAPRDPSTEPEGEEATPGRKQRSRFIRELVGDKQERAEAKAERLALRADTNAILKAKLNESASFSRSRGSHQGTTPSIAQMLAELRLEPLRDPLDEQVEVVGETYHVAGIKKVFRGRGLPIPTAGIEVNDSECVLIPEPWNPHDANAVAVVIDGHQVGHLPAELAEQYAVALARIAGSGHLVTGVARIWAKDDGAGMVRARVTILIPEVSEL
ncbi:DUF2510 domain-containing protein [Aeromicrobium sp.]|uniref:DUF2510 domain-containing protein n=1 Tax=Aeromicrobium sp. TaxID=1871063 RepID=UPI002FC8684D